MEELHIGERIKERAKELRMGATELGGIINTSKQNIYGIYKRETIDTGLLKKISEALDHDFFALYAKGQEGAESATITMLYEDVRIMRAELDKLRIKEEENPKGATVAALYEDIQLMRNEIADLKGKYESLEKGGL